MGSSTLITLEIREIIKIHMLAGKHILLIIGGGIAAYKAVDAITFPDGFCRRDIGWREVERETAE